MQLLPDGGAVLICAPTVHNKTGVFRLRPGQVVRHANRTGTMHPMALKALIGVSNGSSFYTGEVIECKAGDIWSDKKSGAKGIIEKDHWQTQNDSVELGLVAQEKMADTFLNVAATTAMANYGVAPAQKASVSSDNSTDLNQSPEVVVSTEPEPTI